MKCNLINGHTQGIKNLLNAIGLPKHTRSFKIECDADSMMEISCIYYPEENILDEDGELITFFKKYNLVEKEDKEDNKEE